MFYTIAVWQKACISKIANLQDEKKTTLLNFEWKSKCKKFHSKIFWSISICPCQNVKNLGIQGYCLTLSVLHLMISFTVYHCGGTSALLITSNVTKEKRKKIKWLYECVKCSMPEIEFAHKSTGRLG